MTIFRFRLLTSLALAICSTSAFANYVRPFSSKEKLDASDLVVVASLISCTKDGMCEMRVRYVLKGNQKTQRFVFNRQLEVAELTADCCTADHLYLMYLQRGRSAYGSVNGRYGVINLSEPAKP